jgi:hypothetical protein
MSIMDYFLCLLAMITHRPQKLTLGGARAFSNSFGKFRSESNGELLSFTQIENIRITL